MFVDFVTVKKSSLRAILLFIYTLIMEKPPIKIKNLSELTNSLVEKIQLIDSPTLTVKYKMKTFDELLNIVEKLRVFFQVNKTEDNLSFDNQLKRMFEQFNWEVHLLKKPIYDFTKYSEYSKQFLSSLLKILGKRGCGILIIETYTKVCLKALHDLIANCGHDAKISEDLHNFKLLLEGLSSTTKMLKKYWHVIFLQSQKNATMLCLNQICKGLPFLLKTMMEARNNQVKKYIIDRLIQCFNKIIDELHSDGELQPSFGSEFIQLMDAALYNLNQLSRDGIDYPTLVEVSNDVANNLKPLIDELLCHAMSIAQVTSIDNDYKAIIASSQKVLKEFEQLVQNIKDENGPEIKLDATGLSETLCKLEQRVNTAVLRLVLEVFTHVNSPLKNMVNKCRVDSNKDNKYSEDLNILISEFDAEMDKIMQIGLFAVSCSTDVKRILGIKSCLASLESLEAELIPCLTALYMDSNSSNKNIFQFLIEQWLKEITELKILIDSILDPAAFCEVVENQMEELISSIKGSISSTFDVNNVVKSIEKLIRYSKKLIKMLNTSMEEDEVQNTEAFKKLSLDLQLAVQECEASIALLTKDQDVNKNVNRVVKRSELVLSSVHKILEYLFKSLPENESDLEKTKDQCLTLEEKSPFWHSTRLPQKNYYRLCTSIPDTTPPPQNIEALTPFLTIGKMRAKERSILYVTPKRTQGLTPITPKPFDSRALRQWDNTPRSRNRSRCCKPLPLNLELGNTLDLEVTTVLENLSELSNTFSKSFSETQNATACKTLIEAGSGQEKDIDDTKPLTSSGCRTDFHDKPEDEKDVENFLGDKLRTQLFQSLDELTQSSSLLVLTESNDLYTTQERLKDLKIVEQRINFLQSEVPEVFF